MARRRWNTAAMRDVVRRNWRFWVALAEILVLTVFFAHYIGHRQQVANHRAEIQRQAICAILANIPGHIPAEIAKARQAFARPGHASDCLPIRGAATPKPTPIRVYINGKPAVIVVNPPKASPAPTPRPTRTAHPTPRPTPTRTRSPSPKPTPSPSRTCIPLVNKCLTEEAMTWPTRVPRCATTRHARPACSASRTPTTRTDTRRSGPASTATTPSTSTATQPANSARATAD